MDAVKLTNEEILRMYGAIVAIANVKAGSKFGYALARTRRSLLPQVESLKEIDKPSDDYTKAYDEPRLELCREYALRGESGPSTTGTIFNIDPARQLEFDAAVELLRAEHKDVVDAEDKRREEFKALLKEETSIEIHRVALDQWPELTMGQLDALLPMVKDGDQGGPPKE